MTIKCGETQLFLRSWAVYYRNGAMIQNALFWSKEDSGELEFHAKDGTTLTVPLTDDGKDYMSIVRSGLIYEPDKDGWMSVTRDAIILAIDWLIGNGLAYVDGLLASSCDHFRRYLE